MSEDQGDIRAKLEAHARRDDLARLTRTVALSAADERRARFSDGLDELLREAELEPEDGVVGSFNVLRALSSGQAPTPAGREVLGALLARGLRLDLDGRDEEADDKEWARIAESLCWLAANTHLSALSAIDAELEREHARRIWDEMGAIVLEAETSGAAKGRALALAAACALHASADEAARDKCSELTGRIGDPLLLAMFSRPRLEPAAAQAPTSEAPGPVPDDEEKAPSSPRAVRRTELSGEMVPAPLGPVGLVLWTITGLILIRYLFRFIGNVLLRFKRPVEVTVSETGITLESKLDVLGKTVRTEKTHIPLDNLARAVREVKYPRLAIYAGLTALAIGTYVGVSLATDGARAGSPSLLGLGAGVFAAGVVIDLVFSTLLPGKTGKHRVIFVPRKGRKVAISTADESAADAALRSLSASATA